MPILSLRLLGAFHVECDGRPINGFATDKARTLLAFLAVERGRPHRRESLAALLWPDQNDERARQSLRQALSHLKQALGDDEFLLISPQDIQLHPQASVWTDIGAVEALSQACERHPHRGLDQCLPCLRRQEELLTHYQGDFLTGFSSQNSEAFEEWAMLTRERLHQQAINAHIALAFLSKRRGDLATALQHARAQIQLEPWREEAHRQAMRLLAQSGERSSAISQYQLCQRVLEKELSAAPTAETTALYENIQRGSIPAPRIPPLPADVATSFVGRAREQDELSERLADPSCRLVTILGMGGMGKSRLALQVARAHAGLYRDGIFFIPLAGLSDALPAIAAALGLAAPDVEARLPQFLCGKHLLLVLDNFEHLVDTSESLGELLSAAPDLQIIVTSRERLRLREEWVYPLDGLSFPTDDDGAGSGPFDSLALFERRAAQTDPRFKLTPGLLPDLSAICRLVEGHPLAIELAASAAAERPCDEIATSLRQTFDGLTASLRNFPARHRSLRAVFEHSWSLLPDDERTRLAELSVFAGGFAAEAARTVTGASSAQLSDLAAKSLLRRDMDGRYSLHESIRQFAAEKLAQSGLVQSRHAAYFAALATRMDRAAPSAALDTLQQEQANLRAAWIWSVTENTDLTANLLTGLSMLYSLRGPISEGEALFSEAVESLGGDISKKELRDSIALELARMYNTQAKYEQAIVLAQNVDGAPPVQAKSLLIQGQALDAQGECEIARPLLEKSLALARRLGDRRVEADSLRELGNAANRLAEYDLAMPLYQQSLVIARELGDKRGESATLNNWASVEWDLGELDAAQANYGEALALYRELGNRLGEAKALNNLSNVAADRGDLGASLQFCEQALRIHREMGNPRGQSAALNNLGATYFSLGQYESARGHYQGALALHRESGNRQAEGETLANLSLLDCVQGRLAAGQEKARQAISLSEQTGDKVNLANAFYYLGRIELANGNILAAEEFLRHALETRREVPHPGRLAEIQAEMALCALQQNVPPLALERISPVLELLSEPDALDGTDEPFRIYALSTQVLAANQDARAISIHEMGLSLLEERASQISDQALRKSFKERYRNFQLLNL